MAVAWLLCSIILSALHPPCSAVSVCSSSVFLPFPFHSLSDLVLSYSSSASGYCSICVSLLCTRRGQGTTSLVPVYLIEVGPTYAGREQSSKVKVFTENLK